MDALKRLESPVYIALRTIAGLMFAVHGMQKLLGVLTDKRAASFGTQMWFGGCIELGCGALIAIGVASRPAAFLASGMMAVAYIQFHWKGALDAWRWIPAVNGGEMAILYCFLFLFVSTRGLR